MNTLQNTLYLGKTYFFNKTNYYDERLICIGDSLDEVSDYFIKIRHIPVVDEDTIGEMTEERGVIAMIVAASFPSQNSMLSFLNADDRYLYTLVDYGKIDRKIAGIKKKDARNVKIPLIISQLIESDNDHFLDELRCTSHSLKNLFYFTFGFDTLRARADADGKALMRVCNMIDQMTKGEGEMADEIYKRHPILFCGEEEYRSRMDTFLGMKGLDDAFQRHLYEED